MFHFFFLYFSLCVFAFFFFCGNGLIRHSGDGGVWRMLILLDKIFFTLRQRLFTPNNIEKK